MNRPDSRAKWSDGQRWTPLVALVLVLVSIGHDLLRAVDVHSMAWSDHQANHAGLSPAVGHPGADLLADTATATVGSDCGLARPAVRPGEDLLRKIAAPTTVGQIRGAAKLSCFDGGYHVPVVPARERRAHLHVYRI